MTTNNFDKRIDRLRLLGADDEFIEAKEAVSKLPKSVWDSVSAFANTDGGEILLGLSEPGFVPCPGFDPQKTIDALDSGLSENPKVEPVPEHEMHTIILDGAPVVSVCIKPIRSGSVCYVKAKGVEGGSFKRVADKDKKLSPYEIYLRLNSAVALGLDRNPIPGTSLADLDDDLVDRTLTQLERTSSRAFKPGDATATLQRLNVLTNDGTVTLAGLLALGEFPQQLLPNLYIDVAIHPTSNRSDPAAISRFLDRVRCDGPLAVAVSDAVFAVVKNLRVRRVVRGTAGVDEPEIPVDVLRESITNAIVHRDYSDYVLGQQVSVDVFPDRVEVTSPGGLFGDRNLNNLDDGRSTTRNEFLARILQDVPLPASQGTLIENRGSGIPLMNNAMRSFGLPVPEYEVEIDHFRVILHRFGLLNPDVRQWLESLVGFPFSEQQSAALALSRIDGDVQVHTLRTQLGLDSDDARAVISELVEEGLLDEVGGERFVLRERVPVREIDREVVSVLNTNEPATISDIAAQTGRNPNSLRPILRRLVSEGFVTATAPPSSRNRAYLRAT